MKPAAVILVIDTSIDDSTTDTLFTRQLAIAACALIVLLALAVFVLRLGLRPLAEMAAIAEEHLTERLPIRGDRSETDQLAEAVNRVFDAQARAEAAVRSLAADTSHELRTPLSTISGWLDLHRQGALTGPGLDAALGHIEDEVGRMQLLVEDLSLLARLDAGRPLDQAPVDVTSLAADVVEDAHVIHPDRTITLTAAGPAPVTGDAARLQQVLRNLVATPSSTPGPGRLCTSMSPRAGAVSRSTSPTTAPASPGRTSRASSNASGAPSRSRAYGGSGLGLAIVEAIIHPHQGQVTVESTVGVGTTVTVRLKTQAAGRSHVADSRPR